MATTTVYADGESTGSNFHLLSYWTGNGAGGFKSRPTVGSTTRSYTLNQPKGAKIKNATVYAKLGSPLSGVASGWPKANETTMLPVAGADANLYSASIEFENEALTTSVTYSTKCNGWTTDTDPHCGSLSFQNVYLVVEYTPPCSNWTLDQETIVLDGATALTGRILLNEDNRSYSHRITVKLGDKTLSTPIPAAGAESTSDSTSFSIDLLTDWNYEIPIDRETSAATVTLETLSDGYILGAESKQVIFDLDPNAAPYFDMDPFELTITNGYTVNYRELLIYQKSGVIVSAMGLNGDDYHSTIQTVQFHTTSGTFDVTNELLEDGTLEPIQGKRSVQQTQPLNLGVFMTADVYTISVTVTDSRGRQASQTTDLYVEPYEDISIASARQGRLSNDQGTQDSDAWYAQCTYTMSPLSGGNKCTLTLQLINQDGTNYGAPLRYNNYVSGQVIEIADPSALIPKTSSYTLQYTQTDNISKTVMYRTIGSAYAFMRWEPEENRIGFGCFPTAFEERLVEIGDDWRQVVNHDLLMKVQGDNGEASFVSILDLIRNTQTSNTPTIVASATEPDSPTEGMIWLDIS